MKITAISRRTLTALAALAMLGAGSSCVNDNSLCPEDQPGFDKTDVVWLSLNITNVDPGPGRASAPASRAEDPEGHPEEVSTADENYIDCNDVTLMLLDNNGRLLRVFAPGDFIVEPIGSTGDSRDYSLKFNINTAYFAYAGNAANIDFRLLFVANSHGTGDTAPGTFGNGLFAMSVPQMAQLHRGFAYTGLVATDAWTPSITGARHIPMAGVRSFSVSRTALESHTDASDPLDISSTPVEMQRTMAKLRVIDAMAGDPKNPSEEKITSVRIKGVSSRGAFLPDAAGWNERTVEVEDATWLQEWYNADAVSPMTAPVTNTTLYEGRPYMICYVTECGSAVVSDAALSPRLLINTADNTGATFSYEVSLSSLAEPVVKALSRNHIHEFVITKSWQSDIDVLWTVCDWNEANTDIDFN